MRLSISNIAWDVSEDLVIAKMLNRYGFDAIDIAPGKYFLDPVNVNDTDVLKVKSWWLERGIEIVGMQAILFGTIGLNIFGEKAIQETMLTHLSSVCRIAATLGAKRVVFGSPRNRDSSGLSNEEAVDIATSFFRRLGDIAKSNGVYVCLEPNPTRYGANFMTTSLETAKIVNWVAHSSILMQFDTGALYLNNENPVEVLRNYGSIIGHIHASEPDLAPLGDVGTDHSEVVLALNQYLPKNLITIEMLATANEPHESSVERALNFAVQHYRNEGYRDIL